MYNNGMVDVTTVYILFKHIYAKRQLTIENGTYTKYVAGFLN